MADQHFLVKKDGEKKSGPNLKVIKQLITNRMFIGIYLAQYCINALTFFFISWFPVYLVQARGMDILHGPYFTRNVVILTDETGHIGVGEVPGVGKITAALEQVKKYVIGAQVGDYRNVLLQISNHLNIGEEERGNQTFDTRTGIHGFYDIIILEGSWIGDDTKRAFSISGIEKVAEKYKVPLLDTKDDTYCKIQAGPIEMEISKTALDLDFIITMPVLKGHCQTKITGALKNFKGCLSDKEKRHFHTLGLHRPIAYLNTVLHPGFILMDGLCGDLDFEEGGNPVPMNRIVAGLDPVLIDSYAASAMGYEPGEIGYIKMAAELGVGSMDLKHDLLKFSKYGGRFLIWVTIASVAYLFYRHYKRKKNSNG